MPCKMWLAGKVCKRGHSCTYAHVPTSLTKFLAHLNSAKVGDAKSSLGDAESSLGDTLRARWVALRARWVTR
jgi:hypothetical protein